jgi:hypothetical protein
VINALVNLAVFLFIMTGVVYQTQHWRNPASPIILTHSTSPLRRSRPLASAI